MVVTANSHRPAPLRRQRLRDEGKPEAPTFQLVPAPRPAAMEDGSRLRRFARAVRAWMLVLPVDTAALLLPILWTPEQWKAYTAMAALTILLISSGGRYRARLHLSVLDDLPSLAGRLAVAAAMIATVIALRHDADAVITFLTNFGPALALVVTGRLITMQVIGWSRYHKITRHRAVMIGGGPLAVELAEVLRDNPRYGIAVEGFVDDGVYRMAGTALPRLGNTVDLDDVVRHTGADVLLVVDGDFLERDLLDLVRTPACMPCDLLVVPRLHQFHTQTGMADHIGSIPIMRIRTPSLRGPARLLKRIFDVTFAGIALVLAFPVLAACALAVRVEGGPGVIFRQHPGVRLPQVPLDAPGRRRRVGDQLVGGERQSDRARRPVPPQDIAGRAATALEHLPRRHERRRTAARTSAFRDAVLPAVRALRAPSSRAGRSHGPRPGEWAARRHVHRRPRPIRQLLHRELVALA